MEGFDILVGIHNVLRWVVVVAAVAAIAGAWHGVITKRAWGRGDRLRTVAYVASMDLQLLLGLLLYVQSPLVKSAFSDPGAAMGESAIRFFFVEHISLMILAVIVVHVGSVMAKRADDDVKKHKRAATLFTLGFVLILVGTYWIWMNRPLIPFT